MRKLLLATLLATSPTLGAELGGLTFGEDLELELSPTDPLPALRISSFGDTKISFLLQSDTGRPYLVIEGPLPQFGDSVPVGEGPRYAETKGQAKEKSLLWEIVLKENGIYRVIAGTFESLGENKKPSSPIKLKLTALPLQNGYRPSRKPSEILTGLSDDKLDPFMHRVEESLKAMVADLKTRRSLLAEFHRIRARKEWEKLDRFPTLPPLSHLLLIRPLLDGNQGAPPKPGKVLSGDLFQMLSEGKTERGAQLPIVIEEPFEIRYGHFYDLALPKVVVDQSPVMAQVLTSLASANGSRVSYRDPGTGRTFEIRSPEELFQALLKSNHKIEICQERVYANFLSFTAGSDNFQWPVWLDTAIKLSDGTTLIVPMGHAQYAFRISGPVVNARVVFFIGIDGVGFFPQIDERPAWTGYVAKQMWRSGENDDQILKAIEIAARYLRRIHHEVETVAKGKLKNGYGFLGVCNDSTALIQYELEKGKKRTLPLPFPLVRAKSLLKNSIWNDGLDEIFAALPHDADPTAKKSKEQIKEVLTRTVAMTPYPLDSPLMLDKRLKHQLEIAEEMLRRGP